MEVCLCSQAVPVYCIFQSHNHKTSTLFRLRKKSNFRGLRWLADTRKAHNAFYHFLSMWFCQLRTGTCHLSLQGLGHKPLQLLTFSTPWGEFRVEISNKAVCALGKIGIAGLQRVKIFPGEDFISPSLKSPHIQKSTKVINSWLAASLCKNVSLTAHTPPQPSLKSYVTLTFPYLYGEVSQRYSKCCLGLP